MLNIYSFLIKWSEVWPIAIALTIFVLFKQKENTTIIFWMLSISLLLHFSATYISLFTYKIPEPFNSNNIYYNLLAVIKSVLFGVYFLKLKQLHQYKYLKVTLGVFIAFTIINFLFIESIFDYSTNMVMAESVFLLIYTLTFFLDAIIDDEIPLPITHPAYFISAAIGISESINFFIYLFLYPVFNSNMEFAILTMHISSYAYIIYGLIITSGLYVNRQDYRLYPLIKKHE